MTGIWKKEFGERIKIAIILGESIVASWNFDDFRSQQPRYSRLTAY